MLRGRVLDVAVDVRVGSPNFGRHVAVELSEENRRQLWVPRGFAHGFVVLSETADFFYKCDDLYSPKDEISVRWNDPAIGIDWGVDKPSLVGQGRRRAAAGGRQKPSGLWAGLMRILLTGTNGQVGGALLPLLAKHGVVIAPSRAEFDLSKPETLADSARRFQARSHHQSRRLYRGRSRRGRARACLPRQRRSARRRSRRWAAQHRVPLIHFSTDYVFDGSGDKPWREDSPTGPLSVYGASKLAGDDAVRAAGGPHLIVRTSWVYAASGANFLRTIARLAGERKELRIVADQIGAPTTASVIADAIASIVQSDLSNLERLFARNGGVVNLVCNGETSWHGFASAIVAGLKSRGVRLAVETIIPITTADFPTKATRPVNSRLDLSRLKNQFGVTTPAWQDALIPELDKFVSLQSVSVSH